MLLPNDSLAQKAIAASKLFVSHEPFFTLEINKLYPHMSLYVFQLNTEDILKVEKALQGIAAESHAIDARATKYSLGEGRAVGYVDPEYEVTDELRTLQTNVIDALNPLRAGMRDSDVAKMQDATGLKLENLQMYGYPAIGDLFRPHITLTRLKGYKPEVLDLLPSIDAFSGNFDKLGLFEMGDNGTCIRFINSWSLDD